MGGLEVIDLRYRPLWERTQAVLGADDRVISVVLSGSVGAGTADRWSDLDLQVVVEADTYDAFLRDRAMWLGEITPTVFARTPIAPFILNTITDDGLTFDLAIYAGRGPGPFSPPSTYSVGLLSGRRFDDVGDALEYAVAEQLRGLAGPFISLLQRDEHLFHLTGVPHILGSLTTVFLAETESPPPTKHWNRTFTPEQRAAVATLPPVSATRDGLIGFGLGVAELVVRRARPLYPRYSLRWPTELATVAARRVDENLGIDISAWLH
jgi:hypothetical protein